METAGRRSIAGRLLAPVASALAALSPVTRYIVDGPSMEPAYLAGDRIVVNRLAFARRKPRRGDVIVLRDPADRGRLLLKRIANVVDDGVGKRRYYVLGDNRLDSRDSRAFGPVDRRLIRGKAWFRY